MLPGAADERACIADGRLLHTFETNPQVQSLAWTSTNGLHDPQGISAAEQRKRGGKNQQDSAKRIGRNALSVRRQHVSSDIGGNRKRQRAKD
jgi:hypothetical protein